MLQAFLQFIQSKQLFENETPILLTVSGGIDSVVLAHLCFNAGFRFGIAHCNFQLRGEESEKDAKFVEKLAAEYNVPFFSTRFDTKKHADEKGISTQMAARDLRYEWFEKIRKENCFDFIITAHHQDDSLETVLINLIRGTGLAGLHGIPPKNGKIVRPLLFTNRQRIESYLVEHQLQWREDCSNASVDYIRNKLRHEVLPIFKAINPQITSTVFQLSERVHDIEGIISESMEELSSLIISQQQNTIWIHKASLETLKGSQERLHFYLSKFGFTYYQTTQIWKNRNQVIGKQFSSNSHLLTNDRQHWVITPKNKLEDSPIYLQQPEGNVSINGQTISWRSISGSSQNINFTKEQIYLNADALQFPLVLRPWKHGDKFCPAGMRGQQKKVSDFLIDSKIPRNLKSRILVIESNHQIAWIVGLRIDERFKATKQNENILEITLFQHP